MKKVLTDYASFLALPAAATSINPQNVEVYSMPDLPLIARPVLVTSRFMIVNMHVGQK